jgi:hypothetical protein
MAAISPPPRYDVEQEEVFSILVTCAHLTPPTPSDPTHVSLK